MTFIIRSLVFTSVLVLLMSCNSVRKPKDYRIDTIPLQNKNLSYSIYNNHRIEISMHGLVAATGLGHKLMNSLLNVKARNSRKFRDPSINQSKVISSALASRYNMHIGQETFADRDSQLYKQRHIKNIDYLIDIKTLKWKAITAGKRKNMRIKYQSRLRLLDIKSNKVLFRTGCSITKKGEHLEGSIAPTVESIVEVFDDMVMLSKQASDECAQFMLKRVFNISVRT